MASIKTCKNCRFYFYCSKLCQQEDWVSFHSRECTRAQHKRKCVPSLDIVSTLTLFVAYILGTEYQPRRRRVTARLLYDRLVYLEAIANHGLPPLPQIIESRQQQRPSEPSFIACFNFNPDAPEMHTYGIDVGPEYIGFDGYLKSVKDTMTDVERARIRSMAADVEINKDSAILVEGTFPMSDGTLWSVCAKMQYSPLAPSSERYKILGSVFREFPQAACSRSCSRLNCNRTRL